MYYLIFGRTLSETYLNQLISVTASWPYHYHFTPHNAALCVLWRLV